MTRSASTLRRYWLTVACSAVLAMGVEAAAVGQQTIEGLTISSEREQKVSDVETRFSGRVSLTNGDMTFAADDMTLFPERGVVVATGHVMFTRRGNRIDAESARFSIKTQLGSFGHAYGVVVVETNTAVYFYGETVDQTTSQTYRVTNGGITSSPGPNPEWHATSAAIVVRLR